MGNSLLKAKELKFLKTQKHLQEIFIYIDIFYAIPKKFHTHANCVALRTDKYIDFSSSNFPPRDSIKLRFWNRVLQFHNLFA